MDNMTFKTFTWPVNPERYAVQSRRVPVYSDTDAFTGLGPVLRTITGSGAFFGADAYTSFQSLSALLADGTAGTLVHPVWGSLTAFLTELTLAQEPRAAYVAYTFTFREADSSGGIPK